MGISKAAGDEMEPSDLISDVSGSGSGPYVISPLSCVHLICRCHHVGTYLEICYSFHLPSRFLENLHRGINVSYLCWEVRHCRLGWTLEVMCGVKSPFCSHRFHFLVFPPSSRHENVWRSCVMIRPHRSVLLGLLYLSLCMLKFPSPLWDSVSFMLIFHVMFSSQGP